MPVEVYLICHSTAIVACGEMTLLFDYSEKVCGRAVRELTVRALSGRSTVALFSHAHGDHFDIAVRTLPGVELFVLPPDVPESEEKLLTPSIKVKVRDERELPGGLFLKTYPSTDEGVAYLIEGPNGGRVFFAGDLALWAWPGDEEEDIRKATEEWKSILKEVSKELVDVAFLVADPRLPHLGGFEEALDALKPRHAFPIHNFGNLEYLKRLWREGVHVPTSLGEKFRLILPF